MSAKALPSGLSIADLMANLPCDFWIVSNAKRGPTVRWTCRFCHMLPSKTKVCPMLRERKAKTAPQTEEGGDG